MADDRTESKEENGEENGERQGMKPREAVLPISMMLVLIIVTISLALFVGPIYSDLGLSAVSEEYSNNPLIIVYFLGMLLFVTGSILLLRKFLKRKKRKFMRYILAAAVLISTIYVVNPLVDIAFNGLPPHWEAYEIDSGDYSGAVSMQEKDYLVYSDSEAVYIDWSDGEYDTAWTLSGGDRLFLLPIFSSVAQPTIPFEIATQKEDRFIRYSISESMGADERINISSPLPGSDLTAVSIFPSGTLLTLWSDNGNQSIQIVDPLPSSSNFTELTPADNITDEIGIAIGDHTDVPLIFSGNRIYTPEINTADSTLILTELYSMEQRITWISQQYDDALLVGCASSMWHIGNSDPVKITDFKVTNPHTTDITTSGSTTEILFMHRSYLYSVIIEDGEYKNDGEWGISGSEIVSIQAESPKGDLTIISEEDISKGVLDRKERFSTLTNIITLIISVGLVGLILFKPKWYLIDMVGILMGAGVLSLIGISIPPLLLVILMVLLAVYDFISVYITKHMIALADTVVEAKLPILLVFPKTFSFNYEESTNLMEAKRKGESMFMGLGDVIIPGALIVSSMLFLPDTAIHQIGFISGPLAVALFSLLGMLASFMGLMTVLVIKGKAHAGLPFLNTGTILGFLIGHFIVYGTFMFF